LENLGQKMSAPSTSSGLKNRIFDPRFVFWWSIVWGIGIMALSPLVNYITPLLNPAYANQWTPDIYWRLVMYWHGGIFIPWITALAVLVYVVFKLDSIKGISGRLLKDSILIGGFVAVPVAGVAGLFDVYDNFALGVPLWTQIFAFLIGDEMAVALVLAMLNKPRQSGKGFRSEGLAYYTVILAIISAIFAAVMGHIGGWISWFGPWPSVVPQYINYTLYSSLGFYNSTAVVTFTENVVGSHSHLMVASLMAGVIGLVASYFGYDNRWKGTSKGLSAIGFAIMIVGLLSALWVYIVSGVGNYAIPTLFESGPNGIAFDDILTGVVGFGGLFVLVGLLLYSKNNTNGGERILLRDPLFISAIVAWLLIYLVVPITGYYIELNESYFSAAGLSFDQAFTRFHQDFGFFVLPPLVTLVLGLFTFGLTGRAKRTVAYLLLSGEVIAFVFGEIYSMVDLNTIFLIIAIFGGLLMGIGAVGGAISVAARPQRVAVTMASQVTKYEGA